MVRLTNDKGLERALDESAFKYVIVCFYQVDSTPCTHFKKEFETLSEKPSLTRKAEFFEIDALENPGISKMLDVKAVPTTLIMKEGSQIGCFEGPYSHEALENRILDLIGVKKKRDA